MILEPRATLYFQRIEEPVDYVGPIQIAEPIEPNRPPSIKFSSPSSKRKGGFPFTVTVEYSSVEGRSGGFLKMRLPQASREEMEGVAGLTLIRLDAGYESNRYNAPPEQAIFFGVLQPPKPSRDGGTLVWDIAATSDPMRLLGSHVSYTANNETVGQVIRALCRIIRFKEPVLTQDFEKITFAAAPPRSVIGPGVAATSAAAARAGIAVGTGTVPYTATKSFMEEIADLVARVNAATGKAYAQVPNISDPFQLMLVDLSGGEATAAHTIDLDSPLVMDANPEYEEAQSTGESTFTGDATDPAPVAFMEKAYVKRFMIRQAFDPRISLGLVVDFTSVDLGSGRFIVDQVEHSLGPQSPWTTTYSGSFLGGEWLEASPATTVAGSGEEATAIAG